MHKWQIKRTYISIFSIEKRRILVVTFTIDDMGWLRVEWLRHCQLISATIVVATARLIIYGCGSGDCSASYRRRRSMFWRQDVAASVRRVITVRQVQYIEL